MLLILLGCLTCLFPLGAYCLYLAMLNNRRSPTVVAGHWDFAGVLAGLSGFLLFGGPALLSGLHSAWRQAWLRGRPADLVDLFAAREGFWLALWAGYFALVIGGAAWLLVRRRRVTAVYNVEPAALDAAIADALERLGAAWVRRGGQYVVGPDGTRNGSPVAPPREPAFNRVAGAGVEPEPVPAAAGRPESAPGGMRASFEVDTFPAACHATLHWTGGTPAVWRAVEAELGRVLAEVDTPANPSTNWFLTAAASMFVIMLVSLGLFIFFLAVVGR